MESNHHQLAHAHDNQHHGHHEHHNHGGGHDHTEHHKMMIQDFKKRFYVSLLLTIPVVILSPMIQEILGYSLRFNGDQWVVLGFSTILFFYGGHPFLKGLKDELGEKSPGMMTLIALAIIVAYVYSTLTVFGVQGQPFFWELATLVDIMLVGHWIEMKSVLGASRSLELLVKMMPSEAHLIKNGKEEDVNIASLQIDDVIAIKPGEKIPADGIIIGGKSNVNESMLTGESEPVTKKEDDEVIGGAINGNGELKVRVKKTGKDSYLAKVINLVEQAQSNKSKSQRLADRAAFWLTVIAISVGIITLATWLIMGSEFVFALERMVTVMVISCPHALGLAIPLVAANSTSIAAQNGLLIRNRTAFENAGRITTMAFDKTGTLTEGTFGVTTFQTLESDYKDQEVLKLAAALERNSEHPIGQGILQEASNNQLELPEVTNFEAITGKGVKGTIDNQGVKVVSPGYLRDQDMTIPEEAGSGKGETVVFVLVEEKPVGFIAVADKIRKESYQAVRTLQNQGIKVLMLTGDNEKVAQSVSNELNLDGYFAEILPDQKLEKVKELQEKGDFVAMTGDGINDAPALAQADIGIAVGSGTDVAAETADIVLVNSNPQDIANLILFGKATYQKIVQNLFWATGYNVVAVPLAAGLLYNWGIMISPALGAVLMSLSTVIVAFNAQLLKNKLKNHS